MANRLVGFYDTQQNYSGTYTYDDLGNRYCQMVNGVKTNYLLDLNAGLTQVLGETTNGVSTNYLLGLDVIGQQQNGVWSYAGTDGLRSLHGLMDSTGAMTFAASYAPFGKPTEQYGTAPAF